MNTAYTVDTDLRCDNWRPLVNWLLYIPHGIIVWALEYIMGVIFLVYWLGLVVTGRLNSGLYGFMAMYERYQTRANSFLVGFSSDYPAFDFTPGPSDNGAHPGIGLELPEIDEQPSRLAAFNVVLAIPHYLWFLVLAVVALLAAIGGWFAVLFAGSWPPGLRRFLVRVTNYYYRIWVYVLMVRPGYPGFGV